MPASDPRKIAEARKSERENESIEHRQAKALEHIADTLESIRAEFVAFQAGFFMSKR